MARSRRRNRKNTYGSLENRLLLAGDSVFFLDTSTNILQIQAAETNVEGATFVNEMSFSIDTGTNELVVTETNAAEQRFDVSLINRISYRGTFGNDRFINNTDIGARVVGFAGDDSITSGGGNDVVIAANGDDVINPGNGDDYVAGGKGNDLILESVDSTGDDRFYGGPDNDVIASGLGRDFVAGNEGDDTINTGAGNDFAFGNDGIDEIFGGDDRDFIYGGDGNDILNGEGGNDRILGQDGDDEINGGDGDDSIVGGFGDDVIEGEAGDDFLTGFWGNDTLRGGIGADRIIASTPTASAYTFGTDIVDAGDDTDVDFILAHPFDDVSAGEEDRVFNTELIRLNQQARFLQQNINNAGWQETASGLQYRIVSAGTGATPTETDTVRVNYSGTLIDGTEFDANDNISFGLNQVIAGWTEGLQLAKVGATIELAIPASLAYGPNGRPGIPGGATLLFTVDLLAIL